MALSGLQHRYKSRLYVSQVKESTFGSGATLAKYVDTPPIPRIRPRTIYRTDEELANNVDGMTKQIPIGFALDPVTLSGLWPTTDLLLWVSAFAMGDDAVDPSGTNRTHAVTMCTPDAFPGSFSIEQHLSTATANTSTDYLNHGCVIDSFTLSGGRDGLASLDFTISGSGHVGTATNQTEGSLGNLLTNDYYSNQKIAISFVAASGEGDSQWDGTIAAPSAAGTFANARSTVLSEAIESWSLTYTNGWVWTRAGGSSSGAGAYGVQPVLGRNRQVTLTLNLAAYTSVDAFVKALAASTQADNAEYTIVIEGVTDTAAGSSFRSFAYVLPLVGIQSDPEDGGGDINSIHQHSITFVAKAETTSSYKRLYGFFENVGTSVFNQ